MSQALPGQKPKLPLRGQIQVGKVSSRYHDDVPPGNVITQPPAAGTRLSKGTAVDIEVSSGPCPVITTVPDLSGKTRTEAEAAITAAGQNPAAGASVLPGTPVHFRLAAGDCDDPIPIADTRLNEILRDIFNILIPQLPSPDRLS